MNRASEPPPAPVPPQAAKQAGEALRRRIRWLWAEPVVWTDRMLAALEDGVKGGKWFSLIDKVHADGNLRGSFAKVAGNDGAPGVDHVTVEAFERHLDANLSNLSEQLRTGQYRPQMIRRHYIPKLGSSEMRPLGIPTVRDRVVQGALRHVLEPVFERDFAAHSYGFRPGRGCKDALRRVDELLKSGHVHVVDADLKSYFDTIPHGELLERIGRKVSDGRVLGLVEAFLEAGVMEGLSQWTPTAGAPQGAVISPLLSNIYLDELDHLMAGQGHQMVRYADDFAILCTSREQAEAALAAVVQWTAQAGLSLHPQKTRIVDAGAEGFDFLGYRFERGTRRPRDKSLEKFKETIRAKTRRCSGQSLRWIILDVNRTMRGWFEYFKHSHRYTFERLDRWVRTRLRNLLRKRSGRRGIAKGDDHHRWTNAYFADAGLFSLMRAWQKARQSA